MARIRRTGARISGASVTSTLPRPFGVMLDEADQHDRRQPGDPPSTPVFLSSARAAEGRRDVERRDLFRRFSVSFRFRSPVAVKRSRFFNIPYGLEIRVPARVRFCLRRKQRREVLFARRKVGFSGATKGPYRRTANSMWRC